jgi:hypothetical protein
MDSISNIYAGSPVTPSLQARNLLAGVGRADSETQIRSIQGRSGVRNRQEG